MNSRRNFIKASGLIAAATLINPIDAIGQVKLSQPAKIKPPALKAGDTIAITSPAGAVWDADQIETFTNILKSFGFKVVQGKTLKEKFGYFAGTDELRANELNEFFSDKKIK